MALATLVAPGPLWLPDRPAEVVPLTTNEVDAALLDPVVFVDQHCWIQGKGGQTMPFRVTGGWDYQRQVLEAMDEEQRLLVLKARQLGISWTADGYALWLCTANTGQTVLVISQGLRESQEEMERIKFMHRRLPPELRRRVGTELPLAERGKLNTQVMEFPDTGSRIICLPSTEHAGTSFTATLTVVHELAKIQHARPLMASLIPTIADGGRLFVVSTAKGYGGVFAELWDEHGPRWHTGQVVGERGEPGTFRPVFISWRARPGRDQAWYEATARGLPAKDVRQEYPDTPKEAFQGSSDAVFAEEFDRHGDLVMRGEHSNRAEGSEFETRALVDPGLNHGLAYLAEVQGRMLFVYHEIHLQNRTTAELARAIMAACAEHEGLDPTDVLTHVDPFGAGRNPQTNKTDYEVMGEEGLLVDMDPERYLPSQRVDQLKVLLKTYRLFVSEHCPDLIAALERAQWKRRRTPQGDMVNEDTYEKDGVHEHCLAAGTRVLTEVGDAPIESVRVGDRVWTRQGLRSVLAAGLTGTNQPTMCIETASGRRLYGTSEHRVWVRGRGWVTLDTVGPGDIMLLWPSASRSSLLMRSSTEASSIVGIPTTGCGRGGCTTEGGGGARAQPWSIFTAGSMRTRMGQSLQGTRSTIAMVMRSTTPRRTWWPSVPQITQPPTGARSARRRRVLTPMRYGHLLASGISLWLGVRGTSATVSAHGKGASRWVHLGPALTVVPRSRPTTPRELSTAHAVAGDSHAGTLAGSALVSSAVLLLIAAKHQCARRAARLVGERCCASCAASHTHARSVGPMSSVSERLVADRVVRSYAGDRRSDVYDLTVAGAHEFFAEGLLVHNCLDAVGNGACQVFPPIVAVAIDAVPVVPPQYSGSQYG